MRNAEFNRESVLRAAMTAFTNKGFSKTSMQDLTKATGLHPGSIYCAFNNKKGLLMAAIEQYQQDKSDKFKQFFTTQDSPLTNLEHYLDYIVNECASCDPTRACLASKSLSELGEHDADVLAVINAHFACWQHNIETVIADAKQANEITSTDTNEQLAQYLIMGIFGLRTFAYTQPQVEKLQPLAKRLLKGLQQ
ncbi:TetR/AcrR family transcriptional regulator [Shewanella intestini]|uniref:TetR/AcrR family transcriptional regulator n=1 Tax=Shewanella intestini TaxID=2017544 RepID=A0ABS5I341_9GAMM|nr:MULTISPECIES: TetR/AcrR family transcriptional regulator [Shewanella]MBR9728457.1 TetR/AcrR family transcriptional regulator [Shewanella intestini]MRG36276.1 TetR family transcriptional regulator [Shewanella sp. XMDDZSB0408]